MKRSLLLISVVCLVVGSAHGQGFIGKRLAIGYDFGSWLDVSKDFSLTRIHGLELGYAVDRKTMIGVTAMQYTVPQMRYFDNVVGGDDFKARYLSYGLQYSRFLKRTNYMAPVGNYFSIKWSVHRGEAVDFENPPNDTEINFRLNTLHVGFNRNSIITRLLLLHFGGELTLIHNYGIDASPNVDSVPSGFNYTQGYLTFRFKIGLIYLLL